MKSKLYAVVVVFAGLMTTGSIFAQAQVQFDYYLSAAIKEAVFDPTPVSWAYGQEAINCSGNRICVLWRATVYAQSGQDDVAFALTLQAVSGHPQSVSIVSTTGPWAVASFLRNEHLYCDPGPCQQPSPPYCDFLSCEIP